MPVYCPGMNGELRTLYTVTSKDCPNVLAVMLLESQARDWVKNDYGDPTSAVVHHRDGVLWEDGRVSLLDPCAAAFYECDPDYTSEPTRRRRELRQQAAAKLTDEELEALGLPRRV